MHSTHIMPSLAVTRSNFGIGMKLISAKTRVFALSVVEEIMTL